MASTQMAERCPGSVSLGRVRLRGYRLAFDFWSTRRGGLVADILPDASDTDDAEVWGVLWRVTEEHATALDRYEGVARGSYRREPVRVESDAGEPIDAFAYVICDPGEEGPTTDAYRALLLEGAREFGFPPPYLAMLEAVPTRPARHG